MATLLSINNYFYRRDGSEAIYQDHNTLLEGAGWDVVPFSMHHPDNPPSRWAQYFVEEIELGRAYSATQKLARIPKVIYSFEARAKLRQLLSRIRPDVAHCHSIYHHLSPSILSVLRKEGIPVVMTLHDLKIACASYHMFANGRICEACKDGGLRSVVARRCGKDSLAVSAILMTEAALHRKLQSYSAVDIFISPCRFYIDKLVEWGWPRHKFLHVPNFVVADGFEPDFSAGRDILYFGRLSPEKGLRTLLRAAAEARVRLRLVGDGPQLEELRREAAECGADVSFLGRLTGRALFDEVRTARATVLPAEWYENAPMVILESYALGKPVIAANIGGIPEMLREDTGWSFRHGDVGELASRLRQVVDLRDAEIEACGRAARRLVEQEYSAGLYRERILQLYQRAKVAA